MQNEQRSLSGKTGWRSPSNIALVKYWGKKPGQIPSNPSLSMTLRKAYTEMVMEYSPREKENREPWLEFIFEGKSFENFKNKIEGYLNSLIDSYPVLGNYCYRIRSFNTFPHSAGIASSASSMSALGLCIAEFLFRIVGKTAKGPEFFRTASGLARLASGSACRSVYGGFTIWGNTSDVPESSDEYAVEFPFEVAPVFRHIHDAILVVNSKEKEVSSRAGHSLMEKHPYSGARYEMAAANLSQLINALQTGDLENFIRITEWEALNLHALMLTSNPSFLLVEPNTLNIIQLVRRFRKEKGIPVCFTLDAGPNIHLLYPQDYKASVQNLIADELLEYCENNHWIDDETGNGPENITLQIEY
jgi:diphosphomevalonate decarboxylase